MKITVTKPEEMPLYAAQVIMDIKPRTRAVVITLSGDLGAGKTAFAQGVAQYLGVEEHVTSPTFVIENIYLLQDQQWSRLIHIDAYRLKYPEELRALGWEEIVVNPDNIIVIEWPERVAELIPEDAIKLHFAIEGDGRIITSDDGKKRR